MTMMNIIVICVLFTVCCLCVIYFFCTKFVALRREQDKEMDKRVEGISKRDKFVSEKVNLLLIFEKLHCDVFFRANHTESKN